MDGPEVRLLNCLLIVVISSFVGLVYCLDDVYLKIAEILMVLTIVLKLLSSIVMVLLVPYYCSLS